MTLGAGIGAGFWWGVRLSEAGRTEPPSSLWISFAMAAIFVTLALVRALRSSSEVGSGGGGGGGAPAGLRARLTPWQWSPERLLGFAALNGSVAIAIAVGFSPNAVG